MDDREAEELLARHNLHVTYGEIRTIKAGHPRRRPAGTRRVPGCAHPDMLDGYRTLLDHADQLEETDPVSKDTFFLSTESARRPEVARHHQRLDRFDLSGDVFVTEGARSDEFDENWRIAAPFGPYPRELSRTYPFTAEVPDALEPQAYEAAADGLARLVELNPTPRSRSVTTAGRQAHSTGCPTRSTCGISPSDGTASHG